MALAHKSCLCALALSALASHEGRSEATHSWWALKPLTRSNAVEAHGSNFKAQNPIDGFILASLKQHGLIAAPKAEPRTLLRRIYFDLTGLPPSPEEIAAFETDSLRSPHSAFTILIDRLLSSPRHGERWARHWMDAVHFSETHGHDQDRIRTNAWPYRDYLIASLNADKPYARFVQEQIAGDVLFPEDPQATVALGFLASGPWDESSLRDIREDTLDRQIARYLDRDDVVTTVMQTFTSTTVQCARCHDHKFDPISQQDYYALQAVFAGVDKANRIYDTDPVVHQRRQELRQLKKRVERNDRDLLLSESVQRELTWWERTQAANLLEWTVLEPQTFVSAGGATLTKQSDNSVFSTGPRPDRDTYTATAPSPLSRITGVRLEVLADDRLPQRGPGRQDNGNLHLSEFQVLLFEPGTNAPRQLALTHVSADFNQAGWTIAHALDRDDKTAWGIHPRVGETHQAVFELAEPLTPPTGSTLAFILKQLHGGGHLIGRMRLSVTSSQPPIRILPAEIMQRLAMKPEARSEDDRAALAAFYLSEKNSRELTALPPPSFVYAAANDFEPDGSHKPASGPRPVHMLKRGEITKPQGTVEPGALACVETMAARFELPKTHDEGARRAALARWLTHPDNPLLWRSIVNRVWHHHFGRGLVATPNDFGRMGNVPSHPELLDWLAVTFRDDLGGSLKKLHRLIVTSDTYQRSSEVRNVDFGRRSEDRFPAKTPAVDSPTLRTPRSLDPDNNLLSRMNRTRLDAEQTRDAILLMCGRLDLRMGGPSDQQFDLQPGIHVTPKVDYAKFDVDSETARRRSVYRFLFRTLPDPLMDALDCPAGDQLTPARNSDVTVQQALALWNNAFIARSAERFATRLEHESETTKERIRGACEWTWGRPPTVEETRDLAGYAARHGLANLCRLLFNSNEFMFVN